MDHPCELNILIRVLEHGRGRQKGIRERNMTTEVRSQRSNVAAFEGRRMEPCKYSSSLRPVSDF